MAVFGGYEVVHELYRHGLGSVSRARSTDGNPEPKYVVKTFQPPMRLTAQDDVKTSVREFLDAVRVQQDVGAGGAKHWAPIYEAGAVGRSGYYVTSFYPRSAQKLISGRVKLTPGGLHAIIASAVEGLLELQRGATRAHGNLKPSNVLIDGEGEMESSPILLTDPCPREQLPAESTIAEARDLEDVGGLICQLVMHRLFRGSQSWPIPKSPEWARLGPKGEAWRELCNRLLNPDGNDGLSLEGLATKLNKLRPGRSLISAKKVLLVLVLLIGGGATYLGIEYTRHKSAWRELCREYETWVGGFQTEMRADPDRLNRFRRDPHVGAVVELLEGGNGGEGELDPRKIAGSQTVTLAELAEKPPLTLGAAQRARRAIASVQQAHRALLPEQWPLLKELTDREAIYRQRGWASAAAYLAGLVKAIEPGEGRHPAVAIDGLLQIQSRLRADLAEIEERWQAVAQTEKTIAKIAAGDRMLAQFPELGRTMDRPAASTQSGEGVAALKAKVAELAELAGQIQQVLQMDWEQRVNRERFAAEGMIYKRPAPLALTDFRDWLREAQDYYRYTPGGTDERAKALAQSTEAAKMEIAALKKEAGADPAALAKVAALEKRLEAARQRGEELAARAWVQKDRSTGTIEKSAAEVVAAITAIKEEAGIGQPHVLRDLMSASNDKATFKVKATVETYLSSETSEPCIRLTITPEQDCYLLILVRDSAGSVSLLVPNARLAKPPFAVQNQPWVLDRGRGFELPVVAPFGRTTFKAIATARPLSLPEARLNPETGFFENILHLAIAGNTRKADTLAALLAPADWATAEAELLTKAP